MDRSYLVLDIETVLDQVEAACEGLLAHVRRELGGGAG